MARRPPPDGPRGLAPAPRDDAGTHRLPEELVALIEGPALARPRASVAAIARRAAGAAAAEGWPRPSYPVVRRIVGGIDPSTAALAHDGPVAYRDRYELVWRRAAERPNEMWQADHTELDILIADAGGRPARPWLTAVEDDCSRAVCGYYVFLGAPSALNTGLALRQAIWHKPGPSWPMCGSCSCRLPAAAPANARRIDAHQRLKRYWAKAAPLPSWPVPVPAGIPINAPCCIDL